MSPNRIRLSKPIVATRAEAERMLGEIAEATAVLNTLKAELDRKLVATRQEYEASIDSLAKSIENKSGLLQQWAESAPEEFSERKSIDFIHGRLGFRTGTPKLKTLAGWTWDRVKSVLPAAFVRTKTEVDKEALLGAHAANDLDEKFLRTIGVKVVQEETFFIEPKLEETAGKVVSIAS